MTLLQMLKDVNDKGTGYSGDYVEATVASALDQRLVKIGAWGPARNLKLTRAGKQYLKQHLN